MDLSVEVEKNILRSWCFYFVGLLWTDVIL